MDLILTGTLVGLIITFCHLLDWLASRTEEEKQKLAIVKWWCLLDNFRYQEAIHKSNVLCNTLLDRIYGKRHFSFRCYAASCCFSVLSILIVIVGAIVLDIYPRPARPFYVLFCYVLPQSFLVGSWVGYLSLIETRLVLRFTSRIRTLLLPFFLALDLLLSAVICWMVLLCIDPLMRPYFHPVARWQWHSISADAQFFLTWRGFLLPPYNVIFYSTFFTSMAFYLYCLSALFFKLVKLSRTRVMTLLEKLEGSDHLFTAIGGFLAATVVFAKSVLAVYQQVRDSLP